jgi:hypothetical protein
MRLTNPTKFRVVGKVFPHRKSPYIFGVVNGEQKSLSTLFGSGTIAIINYLVVKQHLA